MSVLSDGSASYRSVEDYSLSSPTAQRAIDTGLAAAEWYHTDIDRKTMKSLMKRQDAIPLRDTILWAVLHIVFAWAAIALWGSWWSVPFWLAYGVLYGSAADARWHECGHGTAFKTRWMNDVVYFIASFQLFRNPVNWRWSHARHHTDTIIVGRDVEIIWMHPINMVLKALAYVGFVDFFNAFVTLFRNAMGQLSDDERDYVPESEWPRAIFWARIFMSIYAAVGLLTIWMIASGFGWSSAIPFLLIGGPRIYGCWHMVMTGLLQHGGLAENVTDHRLNTRTFYCNPVSSWIYWKMEYHVEHHMFPMVPYYNLPKLHALIKDDLPPPNPSIWAAYKELFAAVMRQRQEPGYYLRRALPPTAKPYKEELHLAVPERGMA